jgi:hypothetical protein
MLNKELNVVTLKPTIRLLAFIDANISNVKWSNISSKKGLDNAYVLKDVIDEDSLIDELEKIYPYIFRYELRKIVGGKKLRKVSISFYDFISCFKFEVHPQKSIINKVNESRKKATFIKLNSVDIRALKNNTLNLMDICDEIKLLNLSFEQEINLKKLSRIVKLKLLFKRLNKISLKGFFNNYFNNYNKFDKLVGKSIRIDLNHRVAHR